MQLATFKCVFLFRCRHTLVLGRQQQSHVGTWQQFIFDTLVFVFFANLKL